MAVFNSISDGAVVTGPVIQTTGDLTGGLTIPLTSDSETTARTEPGREGEPHDAPAGASGWLTWS